MKPFVQRVRPNGFKDAEVTKEDLEWEKSLIEESKTRRENKKS